MQFCQKDCLYILLNNHFQCLLNISQANQLSYIKQRLPLKRNYYITIEVSQFQRLKIQRAELFKMRDKLNNKMFLKVPNFISFACGIFHIIFMMQQ